MYKDISYWINQKSNSKTIKKLNTDWNFKNFIRNVISQFLDNVTVPNIL